MSTVVVDENSSRETRNIRRLTQNTHHSTNNTTAASKKLHTTSNITKPTISSSSRQSLAHHPVSRHSRAPSTSSFAAAANTIPTPSLLSTPSSCTRAHRKSEYQTGGAGLLDDLTPQNAHHSIDVALKATAYQYPILDDEVAQKLDFEDEEKEQEELISAAHVPAVTSSTPQIPKITSSSAAAASSSSSSSTANRRSSGHKKRKVTDEDDNDNKIVNNAPHFDPTTSTSDSPVLPQDPQYRSIIDVMTKTKKQKRSEITTTTAENENEDESSSSSISSSLHTSLHMSSNLTHHALNSTITAKEAAITKWNQERQTIRVKRQAAMRVVEEMKEQAKHRRMKSLQLREEQEKMMGM